MRVEVSQAHNKPGPLGWAFWVRVEAFSLPATEINFASFVSARHKGTKGWTGSVGKWCCSALVALWSLYSQWQPSCFHSCSSAVLCCFSINLFPPAATFLDVKHSRRLWAHPGDILDSWSHGHSKGSSWGLQVWGTQQPLQSGSRKKKEFVTKSL